MSGLKRHEPALRFTSNLGSTPLAAVTPDEIDRYEVYNIINPNFGANAGNWVGTTAASGTADTKALVLINAILDYPRNLEFAIAGSSAGEVGTLTINGRDQFGSVIQEVITFAAAANGGTGVGTKVFAHVTDGTVTFGTYAGVGTPRVGAGTAGTTSLFGLPFKVGGTTDLKMLNYNNGTGAVSVNGGTIAAFIDVPRSAIKAPKDIVGTYSMQAWVRPTFNAENLGLVANLPQRT